MAGGRDAPPVRGPSRLELEARPPRLSNEAWLKLGLLTAAFIGLFYRWIWAQGLHSAEAMEDWGHAFVIPFISGYMVWQQRDRILRTPPTTFWPELAPMMLGVVCYFFFIVGIGNHMLQGLSMLLTLAGMSLLLTGPRLFRYVFLPITYLVFTVTVAEQVMIKLTFELQHIAAVGAWMVLRIAGLIGQFAVTISGNTLTVGSGKPLNVAEACSGMRMVIAFIALGSAVAIFSCRFWWQRVALILLAAPVAIFNNILRVAVLGLLSLRWPNLAVGDAHMLIGTLLLVLGLGIFMGIQWALNRIVVDPEKRKVSPKKHKGVPA
jgi:exosortase